MSLSLQNSSSAQQYLPHTRSGGQHFSSAKVQMSLPRGQQTPLQLFPLGQQMSSLVQRLPLRQQLLKQTFAGGQQVRSFGVQMASALAQHAPLQLLPLAQQI